MGQVGLRDVVALFYEGAPEREGEGDAASTELTDARTSKLADALRAVWDAEQRRVGVQLSAGLTVDELVAEGLLDAGWRRAYLLDTD